MGGAVVPSALRCAAHTEAGLNPPVQIQGFLHPFSIGMPQTLLSWLPLFPWCSPGSEPPGPLWLWVITPRCAETITQRQEHSWQLLRQDSPLEFASLL